ncbi:MAG: hypothetical protein KatS3mg068_1017 [Candidatus Sericytochromatia bacterium]|nr:MAG: hypothetical protein KatS3mg068_1017 [Candidatus Sericytochromatia bacterium]
MSSIGQVKLNGLRIKEDTIKLNGINWQANQNYSSTVDASNTNYQLYQNEQTFNNTSYGDIPAADEIFNFSDNNNQNNIKITNNKQKSEDDRYLAVGIGMAIGAVAGGIAGSFIAPGAGTAAGLSTGAKIGALLGTAVGGFIANAFTK